MRFHSLLTLTATLVTAMTLSAQEKAEPAKAKGPWTEVFTMKAPELIPSNLGVAVSPDGKQIALMTETILYREFSIIDVGTKKAVKTWRGYPFVQPLVWSADGSTLAAVVTTLGKKPDMDFAQVVLWNTKTWEERATFNHPGFPGALVLSADGNIVGASGGPLGGAFPVPGVLKVWDVAAKKEILSQETGILVPKLALSADGKTLAANGLASARDQLVVFDLPGGKQRLSFKQTGDFTISADGKRIVGWNYDRMADGLRLSVWDLPSGAKEPKVIKGGNWRPDSFTLIDNDRYAVIGGGSNKNEVRIYDLGSGEMVHSFQPSKVKLPDPTLLLVRTTPDSSLLLTQSTDETPLSSQTKVRLWRTPFGGKGGEK